MKASAPINANVQTTTTRSWLRFSKKRHGSEARKEVYVPGIGYINNRARNHLVAMIAEFIGTFLFLFFAFSATEVANAAAAGAGSQDGSLSKVPNASTTLYIAFAFGMSLAVNVFIFFRVSGGMFNPAVTFGLALVGVVGWIRAALIFVAQMLGAISASAVVSVLFPEKLNVATTLGGTTSVAQGLFIETILTAELVFTIIMMAAERNKATYMAPLIIGLSLFICELTGVFFTGGSLNPARSFGPCVVLHDFPGYHWLYWVGPLLGAFIAAMLYQLLKLLKYETANPGQDFCDNEMERFKFDEESACSRRDVARPSPFWPSGWEKNADHRGQLPINEQTPMNSPPTSSMGSPNSMTKLMNGDSTHIESHQVMSDGSLPLSQMTR